MKWFVSESFDVFFNLALEEYLCRTVTDDDCFILWTNDDSVVIGRNQNIFEEVNVDDAAADGISLARRNSGGGAVFHDKGNINFSIISTFDENALNSYDEFLDPVIDMLHSLHVPATKRNKSDIAILDNKISGNAQIIKGERIIHHGTLLFDADLKKLKKYLKSDSSSYSSKSTKSVKSRVTNIREYVDMTTEEFRNYLIWYFCRDGEKIVLTEDEKTLIRKQSEKYRGWEWVVGKSPKFSARERCFFGDNMLEIEFFVEKGIIRAMNTNLKENKLNIMKEIILSTEYVGKEYSEKYIREVLEKNRDMFI